MKTPELLIPAGDLEKLETAARFGADAVYVGAGPYSLRTQQTAFDIKGLGIGAGIGKKHNVKVYLAMNIFPFDDDLPGMMEYLAKAINLGIDAVIISDPGLLSLIKQLDKKTKIHLSTQANTINSEAVKFWRDQGVKRIVLGRELNLEQIKKIRKDVPDVELELFIHGAMCMSYSGRCLLSKHMTDRSANQGECTQPCRWEYRLKEMTRPDEEFTIEEDMRGTYVMNSKDLCLIEHLDKLKEAGIDSFKVEGRMKSAYYVALVTKIYRKALDSKAYDPRWLEELKKVSHRNYTTGFYFGSDDNENLGTSTYVRDYTFVGTVEESNPLKIAARNYFSAGDTLEVIDPQVDEIRPIKIVGMMDEEGKAIEKAHNPYYVTANVEPACSISRHSILRRRVLK
ncbi:MAG: U32 family peptidase C-terminal domain-containing protein [Candidatus Margulisiibacteriota bacterium]